MRIDWSELIMRARVYMDDEQHAEKGFLRPEHWLSIAKTKYKTEYAKWHRMGLIKAEPVDQEFTGRSTRIEGVLGVVGVARVTISGFEGGRFDMADFLDGCPSTIFEVEALSASTRPTILFQAAGALSLVENGSATTINYVPGVTTLLNVLDLVNTDSTMFEVVSYSSDAADLAFVLDDLINTFTPQPIEGGVVLTSTFYELFNPQKNQLQKRWRNYNTSSSAEWEAFGDGDSIKIKVYPDDTTSTHVVRYATVPNPVGAVSGTTQTGSVEVPAGCDERLVLAIVSAAMLKEGAASPSLERAIINADAEVAFAAAAKRGGVRLRPPESTPRERFTDNHLLWWCP